MDIFLFGAGASYGCGECKPYPPPLGNGPNGLFAKLREKTGVASTFNSDLQAKFIENFEEGMSSLYHDNPTEILAFHREIANYLASFTIGKRNYYKDLIRLLVRKKPPFLLSSLNYDLLLEQAIWENGFTVLYNKIGIFPPLDKNTGTAIAVAKIHGSSNFLPHLPKIFIQNVKFELSTAQAAVQFPLVPVSAFQAKEFCQNDSSLAPAICMYMKGKNLPVSPEQINQLLIEWQDVVSDSNRIFVIGVSVSLQDTHIWEHFSRSTATIHYFSPQCDDFEDWKKEKGRVNDKSYIAKFENTIPILESLISS